MSFRVAILISNVFKAVGWLAIIIIALGLAVLLAVKIKTEVFNYMANQCKSQWQRSGLEAKWEFGSGCLVNIDGRWVPEAHVQFQPKNSN